MRLSSKLRFALTILADIARHGEQGQPVCVAEVAERQGISVSYVELLVARLREGGVLRSIRGPGGGYLLARPAADFFIGDIAGLIDEPLSPPDLASLSPEQTCTEMLLYRLAAEVRQTIATVPFNEFLGYTVPQQKY